MKILTVLGARPQFIKAAIVSQAIDNADTLSEFIVHTGQHFDENMSGLFFRELGMRKPFRNLEVSNKSHSVMTGEMLIKLDTVMSELDPDAVMVYGDTNSTLAGALAAVKRKVPVVHVEAGLRSRIQYMPEEINRVLVDRISARLCCPTESAVKNLMDEGIPEERISMIGDVMYDASLHYSGLTNAVDLAIELPNNYILCTIHREENTDDPVKLAKILTLIQTLSKHVPIIFPLHPRTRNKINEYGFEFQGTGLYVIEPVGYLEMIKLEKNSSLVVTDSGGVQKEAFFFGKQCVTLREATEWTELVDHGWNILCDVDNDTSIVETILGRLDVKGESVELYGNGIAVPKLISVLESI